MVDPDDKIKAFEYIDRYYEVLDWFNDTTYAVLL
jgi:hypothetical protein